MRFATATKQAEVELISEDSVMCEGCNHYFQPEEVEQYEQYSLCKKCHDADRQAIERDVVDIMFLLSSNIVRKPRTTRKGQRFEWVGRQDMLHTLMLSIENGTIGSK